jgi:hypothetical protein
MKAGKKTDLQKSYSQYCPQCKHYHVGIWKQCPNCRTPLVSAWIADLLRVLRKVVVVAGLGTALFLGTYGIQLHERVQYQESLRLMKTGQWMDGARLLREAVAVNPIYQGVKRAAHEAAGMFRSEMARMKEKMANKPKADDKPAAQVPTVKRKIVW